MMVIGFFRDLLSNFGNVISFITEPIEALKDLGFNVSIIQILSVSLGAFLLAVLGLHIWHLVKPIG